MSVTSIVMMVVAMLIVWGGLVLAIILLIRNDHSGSGREVGPGSEHLNRDL